MAHAINYRIKLSINLAIPVWTSTCGFRTAFFRVLQCYSA